MAWSTEPASIAGLEDYKLASLLAADIALLPHLAAATAALAGR